MDVVREEQGRRDWRLHKHADYQRVYGASRKQFSGLMTYFAAAQPSVVESGPRVGLTAGRAVGKSVERNRIKRRMREAVRGNLHLLTGQVDVVLHPKRKVLEAEFAAIRGEVARIFRRIEAEGRTSADAQPAPERATAEARRPSRPEMRNPEKRNPETRV